LEEARAGGREDANRGPTQWEIGGGRRGRNILGPRRRVGGDVGEENIMSGGNREGRRITCGGGL